MRLRLAAILAVSAAIGAHVPIAAQNVMYRVYGDSALDRFGTSVAGAGDVNGDGYADFIIGAPSDDNSAPDAGSARVFSGFDGTILYTFDGDSTQDWFGGCVSGAGDVNGDGYADLIVGAQVDDNNGLSSGSARVFSGRNGGILYTFDGDSAGDRLGWWVSGAGDVNDDGFADLVVGALFDDNNGADSGSARVLSGRDGTALYTFNGDSAGDYFGVSVNTAGDVDADGFAELIVGAPGDDDNGAESGSARVLSGRDGRVLYTFFGDSAGDNFGQSVSTAGDVDADGFADLIVGAPGDDNNGRDSGSARVFSGRTGAVLYTFNGDSGGISFGRSVSAAGDFFADGFADLIVGARCTATLFSGRDGRRLWVFSGDWASDGFGGSVSGAHDVDGDGFADVIAGALYNNNNGQYAGSAHVISGMIRSNPAPPRFEPFGHGCTGADGRLPQIGRRGRPVLGQTLTLTLRAAPMSSPLAIVNVGLARVSIDLAPHGLPGCRLWSSVLASANLTTDALGRSAVALPVPNNTGLLGLTLHAQWLIIDSLGQRLATTNGAMLRVGRP